MNDADDSNRKTRPLPERHRNKVFPVLCSTTDMQLSALERLIDDGRFSSSGPLWNPNDDGRRGIK